MQERTHAHAVWTVAGKCPSLPGRFVPRHRLEGRFDAHRSLISGYHHLLMSLNAAMLNVQTQCNHCE